MREKQTKSYSDSCVEDTKGQNNEHLEARRGKGKPENAHLASAFPASPGLCSSCLLALEDSLTPENNCRV